jgi:Rrf2 family protein
VRLSARVDYAIRAAAELAAAGGGPVTADRLAAAQLIPAKFLEEILTQLKRSGLVRSQRGPAGGYWLARPADEITMADVIRAVDGPLANVRGQRPEDLDYAGTAAALQQVWIALRASERAVLEEVTLAHLASGRLPPRIRRLTKDSAAWS